MVHHWSTVNRFKISQVVVFPTGIMGFSDVKWQTVLSMQFFMGALFREIAQNVQLKVSICPDGGQYIYVLV